MIISVHIAKTGGASFLGYLNSVFGDQVYHGYFFDKEKMPQVSIIHGHFNAYKQKQRYPEAQLITWMRDPIERVISHYQYWQRKPDENNRDCKAIYDNRWSLSDWATQGIESKNWVSRHTCCFDELKIEDYSFIGIKEYYERSITLFNKIFQIDEKYTIPMKNINPNKFVNEKYNDVPQDVKNKIIENNLMDIKLYKEALISFKKKCDQYEIE